MKPPPKNLTLVSNRRPGLARSQSDPACTICRLSAALADRERVERAALDPFREGMRVMYALWTQRMEPRTGDLCPACKARIGRSCIELHSSGASAKLQEAREGKRPPGAW